VNHAEQNKALWDSRADLGMSAGTNDVRAKRLEMRAISAKIEDGMRVLDIGCGNGITAVDLALTKRVDVIGIDHSEKMIAAAKTLAEKSLGCLTSAEFCVGSIDALPKGLGLFDVIYTERMLVNLPDWEEQASAIYSIGKMLRSGGKYLMVECSMDGLSALNDCRESVGLSRITPPEHTTYIDDASVDNLYVPGLRLERTIDFTSSYYFLSRVVNAWQAKQLGQEPSYDAPVNGLADTLPAIGSVGQVRMWVWQAR